MQTRMGLMALVLVTGCGGASGSAQAPPADAGALDAGGCTGTPPFSCIDFCGSDITPGAECIAGAWGCAGNLIPTNEIDTLCVGKLSGPCINGACEGDRICGDDDRCWMACDAAQASFICYEASGTCCGVATATVTCFPVGQTPHGCPAGAIRGDACTGFSPGC